jgi:hypothetical protein
VTPFLYSSATPVFCHTETPTGSVFRVNVKKKGSMWKSYNLGLELSHPMTPGGWLKKVVQT